MRQVNSENFSLKGIFNALITEGESNSTLERKLRGSATREAIYLKRLLIDYLKQEKHRSTLSPVAREVNRNKPGQMIGTILRNIKRSKDSIYSNDPEGYFQRILDSGKLNPEMKTALQDLWKSTTDKPYWQESFLKEGEAKLSKGNKSSKNSFGDEKVETPWATGKKDDCCDEYGISAEDAEKKIKDIKSLDKLDEEYQRLFLQMDNEMDRYWFRRCYQEIRNKIGQKEVPKATMTNKNFDK